MCCILLYPGIAVKLHEDETLKLPPGRMQPPLRIDKWNKMATANDIPDWAVQVNDP